MAWGGKSASDFFSRTIRILSFRPQDYNRSPGRQLAQPKVYSYDICLQLLFLRNRLFQSCAYRGGGPDHRPAANTALAPVQIVHFHHGRENIITPEQLLNRMDVIESVKTLFPSFLRSATDAPARAAVQASSPLKNGRFGDFAASGRGRCARAHAMPTDAGFL